MGISGENISNPPEGAPRAGGPPGCQEEEKRADWLCFPAFGTKAVAEAAKREAIAIVNFIVVTIIIII